MGFAVSGQVVPPTPVDCKDTDRPATEAGWQIRRVQTRLAFSAKASASLMPLPVCHPHRFKPPCRAIAHAGGIAWMNLLQSAAFGKPFSSVEKTTRMNVPNHNPTDAEY